MKAEFYGRVEDIIPQGFHRSVRAEKGKRYEEIAYILRKKGDFVGSRKAAMDAFRSPAVMDNVGSKFKSLLASFVREMQWRMTSGESRS
jgi:hypothetical protein